MNNGGPNKDRTKGKMYRISLPWRSFASPRQVGLRADLVSYPKTVKGNKLVIH